MIRHRLTISAPPGGADIADKRSRGEGRRGLQFHRVHLPWTVGNLRASHRTVHHGQWEGLVHLPEQQPALNLFPTRTKKVFVGKDGEYYLFRFDGKEVDVFNKEYKI